MATTVATHLPKYIENANRILSVLAEQPDQVWNRTQRELGEQLNFSQPELSTLLKLLFEQERIRRGPALPGVRGKNYVIQLVDATPFDRPVARKRAAPRYRDEDRALRDDEKVAGITDLGEITVEKIGIAVMRALQDAWDKERRNVEARAEQNARLREYREAVTEERRLRVQLAINNEALERQNQELQQSQTQLRSEINKLLVKANNGNGRNTYQLRDLLGEDSLQTLEVLMRTKPGHDAHRSIDGEKIAS